MSVVEVDDLRYRAENIRGQRLQYRKLSTFAVNLTIDWGVHTANRTARLRVVIACCHSFLWWPAVKPCYVRLAGIEVCPRVTPC